jgi:hypothetical protein
MGRSHQLTEVMGNAQGCVWGPSPATWQAGDHVTPVWGVPHVPPRHTTLHSPVSCARLGHGIVGLLVPGWRLYALGPAMLAATRRCVATENAPPRDES